MDPAAATVGRGGAGDHGPKPTAVLVHGAFADAPGWREVFDRFQRRGYDVAAPADLPESQTRFTAIAQRPISAAGFAEKARTAAWKAIPSWFLVARQDKVIVPDPEL
ncbi:hypothetical protein [Streptomyces sp. NPDC008122]|uniref:hypothetical protein n=1 Tax=Streptomyces sp. NPDC008122 TaxID=3364810 RepID=UPI0036EF11E2